MRTIVVKKLPCTENKPYRVKATSEKDSVILSWDWSLPSYGGNQATAAIELCKKMGWEYDNLVGDRLDDGSWLFMFGGQKATELVKKK